MAIGGIIFFDADELARKFGMEKHKIQKQIKELRRRLMDTKQVQWGAILTKDGVNCMRKGGDPELQMLALLYMVNHHAQVVIDHWDAEKLTTEQKNTRYHAINQLADKMVAEDRESKAQAEADEAARQAEEDVEVEEIEDFEEPETGYENVKDIDDLPVQKIIVAMKVNGATEMIEFSIEEREKAREYIRGLNEKNIEWCVTPPDVAEGLTR